jgi:putative toxin-antitoxin system antitoxin component (TIGR02293 family)
MTEDFIVTRAIELFDGEVEAAMLWLTTPKIALGYRQPLEYSKTPIGYDEVIRLIGRIEHGVFS